MCGCRIHFSVNTCRMHDWNKVVGGSGQSMGFSDQRWNNIGAI